MARGKVKFWENKKGFGFIAPDNSYEDVFAHHSQIAGDGCKTLKEGEEVEFDIIKSDKGPEAENIRRVANT